MNPKGLSVSGPDVGGRRICPICDKPLYEDATEVERMADPPFICSPLRCDAWTYVAKHEKGLGWVLTDEEAERRAPHGG
jgi:hypothetical protein